MSWCVVLLEEWPGVPLPGFLNGSMSESYCLAMEQRRSRRGTGAEEPGSVGLAAENLRGPSRAEQRALPEEHSLAGPPGGVAAAERSPGPRLRSWSLVVFSDRLQGSVVSRHVSAWLRCRRSALDWSHT